MFRRFLPTTGENVWFVRRKPDGSFGEPAPFLQSSFNERTAQFSPDGRFVVYRSDESGRMEVYVRSFPDATGRRQISVSGGDSPRWSRKGKEIFYVKGDALLAVPLTGENGSLTAGAPVELFRNPGLDSPSDVSQTYDVAPDGKRFLIAEPVDDGKSKTPSIHVIENWTAILRQKPAAAPQE